jgi:hypothetical protein
MSIGGACKAVLLPMVALAEKTAPKTTEHFVDEHGEVHEVEGEQSGGGTARYSLAYILNVAAWFGAAYLAWQCNADESTGMRVLYTVLAFFLGIFYLAYYVIYRILMGNACKGSSGSGAGAYGKSR